MKQLFWIGYFISISFFTNAQWKFINTGTSNDLYSTKFISKDTGFVAGYMTFLQTFDGGDTWTSNPSINQDNYVFYDIDFPTKKVGYVIGGGTNGVAVFKTIDGGLNWTDVSPIWSSVFYSASFLNSDTGFVCGLGSTIYKTFDGGLNWQAVGAGGSSGPYYRWIQFTSLDTGYICTDDPFFSDGSLSKTTNGINLNPAWPTIFTLPPFTTNKNFQFFDNENGYAGIAGIYKTANGGNSWTELTVLNNSLSMALYFLSKDTGYTAGNAGFTSAIYKTFDGGNSWFQCETQYPDSQYYINEIYFVDKDHGYAAGPFGVFMKTDNGGGFVGIENVGSDFSFSVYPNPATDQLHLSFKNPQSAKAGATITNLIGEQLLIESIAVNEPVIDISMLPSGIYFISLIKETSIVMRKFMKQ